VVIRSYKVLVAPVVIRSYKVLVAPVVIRSYKVLVHVMDGWMELRLW